MLVVNGPKWRKTNQKSKNYHISANVWPIGTEFGAVTQIDPRNYAGS